MIINLKIYWLVRVGPMKRYSPENPNVMVEHLTSLLFLRQGHCRRHWLSLLFSSFSASDCTRQVSWSSVKCSLTFTWKPQEWIVKAVHTCQTNSQKKELRAHWLLGRSRGVKWRVGQNRNVLLRFVRTLIRKYKVYDRRAWSQSSQLLQTK